MKKLLLLALWLFFVPTAFAQSEVFVSSSPRELLLIRWLKAKTTVTGTLTNIRKSPTSYMTQTSNIPLKGSIQGKDLVLGLPGGNLIGGLTPNGFTLSLPTPQGGLQKLIFIKSSEAKVSETLKIVQARALEAQRLFVEEFNLRRKFEALQYRIEDAARISQDINYDVRLGNSGGSSPLTEVRNLVFSLNDNLKELKKAALQPEPCGPFSRIYSYQSEIVRTNLELVAFVPKARDYLPVKRLEGEKVFAQLEQSWKGLQALQKQWLAQVVNAKFPSGYFEVTVDARFVQSYADLISSSQAELNAEIINASIAILRFEQMGPAAEIEAAKVIADLNCPPK